MATVHIISGAHRLLLMVGTASDPRASEVVAGGHTKRLGTNDAGQTLPGDKTDGLPAANPRRVTRGFESLKTSASF